MGLIDFLFGRKNFEFTPIPDDWPPDGSMQFMCHEPDPYEPLPPNFLHYEFGPNCDESDPIAIRLSLKIIEELCQSQQVLTVIKSQEAYHKKRQAPPPLFTERYLRVLQKARPDVSVYLESRQRLAYLTTGYDSLVIPVYTTFPIHAGCFFTFYVFPQTRSAPDAKTALEQARTFQYDLELQYIDHGPTSLEINLNPNTADINFIQAVVEKICSENGVLLMNPPTI